MTNGMKIGRRGVLALGSGLAVNAAFSPLLRAATSGMTAVVKTTYGPVQGVVQAGVQTFKGLRYAAPPTGSRRFLPPAKLTPWTQVADASKFGHATMQLDAGGTTSVQRPLVNKAIHEMLLPPTDVQTESEDCLTVNLWTPALGGARKRPVMVWLHGGGYNYGSANWIAYDGHNLAARHDTVLVAVNHRLNGYGYIYFGGLTKDPAFAEGNVGQLDIVAALQWIKDNIEQFGGDPDNVTVFGQSGGGGKVSNILAMPPAKGLFHRAIIESGATLKGVTKDDATKSAAQVFQALGIKPGDMKALQAVPATKYQATLDSLVHPKDPAMTPPRYAPVVDGISLPANPYDPVATPVSANIPVIVGCTKDEQTLYNTGQPWWNNMTEAQALQRAEAVKAVGDKAPALFAAFKQDRPGDSPSYLFNDSTSAAGAYINSVRLAESKSAQKQAPVYHYVFDWGSPVDGGIMRAPHTIEIPFAFDNIEKGPTYIGNAPTTRALADLVSNTWTAFAKTGNPNHSGLPNWPSYNTQTRASMIFDVKTKVVNDVEGNVRKILEG